MADYPNTGYPPAYPPQQQAAYPPQQPGYPPQQAYPPQPPYPAAQPGYKQPGYPSTSPPPYNPQVQQGSTNVVVVQQQPTVVRTTTVYHRRYGQNDHGLLYAVIASCIVFWIGGWLGLICTLPAIFFSISAQQEEDTGDHEAMKQHQSWSLVLSTVGLGVGFVMIFIWILAVSLK